jgi:hypothetical protein
MARTMDSEVIIDNRLDDLARHPSDADLRQHSPVSAALGPAAQLAAQVEIA